MNFNFELEGTFSRIQRIIVIREEFRINFLEDIWILSILFWSLQILGPRSAGGYIRYPMEMRMRQKLDTTFIWVWGWRWFFCSGYNYKYWIAKLIFVPFGCHPKLEQNITTLHNMFWYYLISFQYINYFSN